MRRLIYVSRSLIDADEATVAAIVRQSCTRNASAEVTGMLWFDGANFAQVLEGDHYRVGETMERINADPRHTDIEIVFDREARTRAFGHWSMAQSDDKPESAFNTALLIGLSITNNCNAAKRLYDIASVCEK